MADTPRSGQSNSARALPALQSAVLEHLPEAVYVRGPGRELLYVNPAGLELTGRDLDEALSLPCHAVFGDEGGKCSENCPIDRAVQSGEPLRHLEGSVISKSGDLVPVEVTVAPLEGEVGDAEAIVILRDMSKLRRLEMTNVKALMEAEKANRALVASEERFRDFADLSSDWLWETDTEHRFTYIKGNTVIDPRRMLGKRREDILDTSLDPGRWRRLSRLLEQREPIIDFGFPTKDDLGREVWIKISGRPVYDDTESFIGYRGVGHEVTEEINEKNELETYATRDYITNLPNRRLFDETLQKWISRYALGGYGFVIAVIDLDGFKAINDRLGHDAGDQVLAVAGQRMNGCVRETDHVARLGGDEFGILLERVDSAEMASAIAQKLIDRLAQPISLSGGDVVRVGASLGLAICPSHGREASDLVQAADDAMYRAKMIGKGRFEIAQVEAASEDDFVLAPQ